MRLRNAAALVASCAAVAFGCGSKRPDPAQDYTFVPPPAPTGSSLGNTANKPPGCGKKEDGSYCDCIDVPLYTNPPNIYFVLDHSGSMGDGEKWGAVRGVLAKIIRGLGPRANYGATMFPGAGATACGTPTEILPLSPGDPYGGTGDGPTTTKLLKATEPPPFGGTPTAAALEFTRAKVQPLPAGKTFVVLFTDGGPNCGQVACGYDKCMANIEELPGCPSAGPKNCCEPPDGSQEACLDDYATTAAVAALKKQGFPVYVVGIPGSARYASLLDSLAIQGGTAQPTGPTKYYRIDSTNDSEIFGTLKKISAQIISSCEFQLKDAPAAPENVNVYVDDVILPADPTNGWKIEGAKVTLLGSACQKLLAGDILSVRIIAGCPTVLPR